MFKIVNNKVDFTDYHAHTKQSEMFLPSIPLSSGHFTDQGFRFRWNNFSGIDKWWPGYGTTTKHFFDVKQYNADTLNVDSSKFFKIAEIYFRIDTDKYNHTRYVFALIDWLGDVGGIGDVLKFFFIMFCGGYLSFNCSLMTMLSLYKTTHDHANKDRNHSDDSHKFSDAEHEGGH